MLNSSAKIEFKIEINEKSYQFLCDNNSPLGELYDALSAMRSFVIEKMLEVEKMQENEEKQENTDG